jgi:hypothetical protein
MLLSFSIFDGCSEATSSDWKGPSPVARNISGFIGLWTNYNGTIYGGWGWPAGAPLQTSFNFGINGVVSVANLDGYSFQANLVNNCTIWNTNQVYGILEPPTGHDAAVNQPADTVLLQPFAQTPGMIQGAHRFSDLSKTYPQIAGVIIDDFGGSFESTITSTQLKHIRDALHGRLVDACGNIVAGSPATSPNLELFVVYYQSYPLKYRELDTLVDGIVLFIDNDQDANYIHLERYIATFKQDYPGKDIILGVDISTERNPTSIRHLLENSIELYDRGELDGVMLFWGWFLVRQGITQSRWDSLAIPPLLDSLYYPYLGEVTETVVDAKTGRPIADAMITVYRVTGTKTQLVTRRITSSIGQFSFGGWASNNGSLYQVEVAKPPYQPNKFEVKLQPGVRVLLPDVMMTQ